MSKVLNTVKILNSYSTTLNYVCKTFLVFLDARSGFSVVLIANDVGAPIETSSAIINLAILVNNKIFKNYQKLIRRKQQTSTEKLFYYQGANWYNSKHWQMLIWFKRNLHEGKMEKKIILRRKKKKKKQKKKVK